MISVKGLWFMERKHLFA